VYILISLRNILGGRERSISMEQSRLDIFTNAGVSMKDLLKLNIRVNLDIGKEIQYDEHIENDDS
jgi:hypothetical protein